MLAQNRLHSNSQPAHSKPSFASMFALHGFDSASGEQRQRQRWHLHHAATDCATTDDGSRLSISEAACSRSILPFALE
jgi:hypothetical protein